MTCDNCGEFMGTINIEVPPGCDDPVFRAYCKACGASETIKEPRFDRDEMGIPPDEDYN